MRTNDIVIGDAYAVAPHGTAEYDMRPDALKRGIVMAVNQKREFRTYGAGSFMGYANSQDNGVLVRVDQGGTQGVKEMILRPQQVVTTWESNTEAAKSLKAQGIKNAAAKVEAAAHRDGVIERAKAILGDDHYIQTNWNRDTRRVDGIKVPTRTLEALLDMIENN